MGAVEHSHASGRPQNHISVGERQQRALLDMRLRPPALAAYSAAPLQCHTQRSHRCTRQPHAWCILGEGTTEMRQRCAGQDCSAPISCDQCTPQLCTHARPATTQNDDLAARQYATPARLPATHKGLGINLQRAPLPYRCTPPANATTLPAPCAHTTETQHALPLTAPAPAAAVLPAVPLLTCMHPSRIWDAACACSCLPTQQYQQPAPQHHFQPRCIPGFTRTPVLLPNHIQSCQDEMYMRYARGQQDTTVALTGTSSQLPLSCGSASHVRPLPCGYTPRGHQF